MNFRRALIGLGMTIVCGAVVALTSPTTYALFNMLWGAEPVAAVLADGTTQTSTIGPKSPWPDWAPYPDGAAVTVRSSSLNSTGVASGHAVFKSQERAGDIQRTFARKLAAAGWTTHVYAVMVTPPEIAPDRGRICVVDGAKDSRHLQVAVDEWTSRPTRGAIFWRTVPSGALAGAVEGPC